MTLKQIILALALIVASLGLAFVACFLAVLVGFLTIPGGLALAVAMFSTFYGTMMIKYLIEDTILA